MLPLDRPRFFFSLAGALLGGDWTGEALRAALRRPRPGPPLNAASLARRLLRAFPEPPEFLRLALFLHDDTALQRTLFDPQRPKKRRATRTPSLRRPAMVPPQFDVGAALPPLPTPGALAAFLGLSVPRLLWLADASSRNHKHPAGPLRTYRYRWIPRREGPPRLLEIPKHALKDAQRKILAAILDHVPPHPAAHGFCRGRSTLTNALPHCGREAVLRFDLADFFPSVSAARVSRLFGALGYPRQVCRLLTGLCTTLLPAEVWEARPGPRSATDFAARQRLYARHLPQGAPTSPALANLAAHRLDRRLAGLAARLGATYTRYADDLTFSGDADLARARPQLEPRVGAVALEEGFALNHRKTRLLRRGSRQHVAGITVNVRPNLPRAHFDRLKAILTNCRRHGPASQNREGIPHFRAHLAGAVAHFTAIHPARGRKLQAILDGIVWTQPPA